jgi:hypothetical protein
LIQGEDTKRVYFAETGSKPPKVLERKGGKLGVVYSSDGPVSLGYVLATDFTDPTDFLICVICEICGFLFLMGY